MFESKYSKLLTVLLIGGIIIIVGALMFFGVQLVRNYYINKDAADAVERFEGDGKNENKNTNTEENVVTNTVAPVLGLENIISGDGSSLDENKKMYKGFPMVGTIEIPAINLKYPVLEEASKSAIEVAVAVYYGPGLNKVGNTTIVGHNYRNGTFFSNNKKLVEGDKVYITDNFGNKITYVIYKTYTTAPEDSDYLDRDTQGKREISLLTCTDDTKSRLIIWAREQ